MEKPIEKNVRLALLWGKIGNVITTNENTNSSNLVVVFDYVDNEFNITRGRRVLPIELKDKEYLIGLDLTKKLQRQFKLEGIQNLQVVKGNGGHLQFTTQKRTGAQKEQAQTPGSEGQPKLPKGNVGKQEVQGRSKDSTKPTQKV